MLTRARWCYRSPRSNGACYTVPFRKPVHLDYETALRSDRVLNDTVGRVLPGALEAALW